MLWESIMMSWKNIVTNKLRSFLTMLGIIIGVASIIALITIVQGATNSISQQVTSLGANKITVNAMGTPLKQGLNEEDMKNIAHLKNIKGVSPTVLTKTNIVYQDQVKEDINVQGKNEVYFQSNKSLLQSGRAINILDIRSKNQVAVIGQELVTALFYGVDPLEKNLIINGTTYQIIGTMAPSSGFSITSTNDTIVIPYTTALRSLGVKNITALDVFLVDTSLADDTVLDIKGVLNTAFNYNDQAYSVFNMGDIIAFFQSMMGMMSLLLGGIAAISLVVGGIGIMNMMLVSITERTTEIGLRKALGATPNRIQVQFLIESIFLSIFGGLIGLILGSVIAYIASTLIGVGYTMQLSTVILAVGFSAVVGIIFGYMPARRASKLNPIDALRSL
ncbi:MULTISPECIES: ABC transporter permease [Dehalobacter]|uniref:FtsX-like permease family protein n=2 Tax=Dehalobacter restrictus TaxID=55583 RepID=A0A857DIB8_9FIRM|nr:MULTISPECIES: ABC transporter permease [Dehalobacter]AHF09946.1 ABC transporter permease [Dehalobacter restrictus DSM 9455]MCG1026238.1 ABC transporter permease [Dehalobacter sp.]MDJ0304541.1 ABC transporter permease [Dehalobacter sp.]OCZ53287.1 ABC transporter permease [Dehalobacter sp. TeCB1]QHA00543.1 FtsX-like permease family protein [Dehalobacter restrictus]